MIFFVKKYLPLMLLPLLWGNIAEAFTIKAKQALLLDMETGTVLFEKNADQQMPTSSLSKLMTMYLVFESLKNGDLTLQDRFSISEKAWRKQGSKTFVKVGDHVLVEDLIRGAIIQSGNDATIALAEGISGSEEAFVELSNEKALELGMNETHFVNATGWPDEGHYSTARDLAILAKHMIQDFPEYYAYYSEKEFTYNNIRQINRNPLLYHNIGADGLKTGQSVIGGMGLIASAVRKGRRLLLVLNGLPTKKDRAQESIRLLDWGFREFKNIKLYDQDEIIAETIVHYGNPNKVAVRVAQDVVITIPRRHERKLEQSIFIAELLVAPLTINDVVGKIVYSIPDSALIEIPLYPARQVDEVGFFGRIWYRIKLFFQNLFG